MSEREECRGAPVHCEEHDGRHPFDPVTCVGAVYDFGPDRAAVLEDAARAVEETEVVEVGSGYLRADDAHATLADAARAVRALAAPEWKGTGR